MDGGSIRAGHGLPGAEIQRAGLFDILDWDGLCGALEWFLHARMFKSMSGALDSDISAA